MEPVTSVLLNVRASCLLVLEDLPAPPLSLLARWTEGLGVPPAATGDVSQVTPKCRYSG